MPGFFLDHLQGDRAGASDHFDQDVVRVGRSPEFELIFDEMGVSWEHAEIRRRDGDFWVIDRGSTNGTYVNDERAHNARLRDGDVVKFGKKGPALRYRTGPSASGRFNAVSSPAAIGTPVPIVPVPSSESAPAADGPVAVALPLAPPMHPRPDLPPRPRGPTRRYPSEREVPVPVLDARSDLPTAAPRPQRSSWVLPLVASLGVLACAGGGTAALLYVDMRQQDAALKEERDGRVAVEADLKAARADLENQLRDARRARADAEAEGLRLGAELERVRRRGEEESARLTERAAQLERDLTQMRSLLSRVQERERERPAGPAVQASGAGDWKSVERGVSHSVVFICTQLEGRQKDGTLVPLHSYGTGFFVSSSGHIVTNKHVVEPWKFRQMAEKMASEGIEVVESSYQVHVWVAGSRFLRGGGNHKQLDLSTGYSTQTGTLELVRMAPDKWETAQLGGPGGVRTLRYHDDQCNEDLALLKARVTSPVTPVRIGSSDSVEKLDEVMVLGFPAGPMILEAGVAETSPATGQVRKVEQTIFVSTAMIGGNSGGPLIDKQGRVVGISTRVVEGTETLGCCLRIEHATALLHGGSW